MSSEVEYIDPSKSLLFSTIAFNFKKDSCYKLYKLRMDWEPVIFYPFFVPLYSQPSIYISKQHLRTSPTRWSSSLGMHPCSNLIFCNIITIRLAVSSGRRIFYFILNDKRIQVMYQHFGRKSNDSKIVNPLCHPWKMLFIIFLHFLYGSIPNQLFLGVLIESLSAAS